MTPARMCYAVMLTGFFGLFLLLMLWPTVLQPPKSLPVALILLVSVTPLLLPMRGLLNQQLKSCAVAAYISLLYFAHGSASFYYNPNERGYLALEIVLSLMLFIGAALFVRFSKPSYGRTTHR
ncbi:DUF2069 domain-containing protein [Methylocucumis oryzae]|nr:DUF2069 domain-containing protein [Methylocucumis oryzae]